MSLVFALLATTTPTPDVPPAAKAPRPSVRLYRRGGVSDEALIREAEPRSPPYRWVDGKDFPASVPNEWLVIDVRLDIGVGIDDAITGCTATVTRVHGRSKAVLAPDADVKAQGLFAPLACKLIRERGTFRHAIDAQGAARAATVPMIISFSAVPLLPMTSRADEKPRPYRSLVRPRDPAALILAGEPAMFANLDPVRDPAASLSIDAEGRVKRCRVAVSTGTDAGDAAMCRHLKAAAFEPSRDREGNALPDGYYFAAMKTGASSR